MFRRCKQLGSQDHQKHHLLIQNGNEDVNVGGWDSDNCGLAAIPVHLFSKHVLDLHMNEEIGFAKEYEELQVATCLDEFSYQDCYESERHPNITTCKYKMCQM